MPDQPVALNDCLEALKSGRLHEVLGRYPDEREELISLLQLSVEVERLQPAPPDPAFRLRARNQMLAHAARREQARWTPAGLVRRLLAPRAVRLAASLALAGAMLAAGLGVAAAGSLPGDPLYAIKAVTERAQLAVTFDPAANARLQLSFAERRLDEAQRLIALGRVTDAVSLVDQYGNTVTHIDRTVIKAPLTAGADARLQTLARILAAGGDEKAALAVTHARTSVERTVLAGRPPAQPSGGVGTLGQGSRPSPPAGTRP